MQTVSAAQGKRKIALIAYLTFIFEMITISLAAYSKSMTDITWALTVGRIVIELVALALMYNGKGFARFLIGTVFAIATVINVILFISVYPGMVVSQIAIIILLLLLQVFTSVFPFIAKDISGYAVYTTQYENLDWVWNWSGKCFGYIDRDELWKYSGQFAGLIVKGDQVDEVYNENGEYICEVYSNGRLTVHLPKMEKKIEPYHKPAQRPSFEPREDKIRMPIYNEYKDFWL